MLSLNQHDLNYVHYYLPDVIFYNNSLYIITFYKCYKLSFCSKYMLEYIQYLVIVSV
jgi:hypothetical protein